LGADWALGGKGTHPDLPEHKLMFRILSIDGGGMKGTFAAAFLDELSSDVTVSHRELLRLNCRDLHGRNHCSALGMCVPTSEILALYKNEANTIFARDKLPWFLRRERFNLSTRGSALGA